jgi:hypothetical protein
MVEAVSEMNVEAARRVVEKASAASSRINIRSCFIGILWALRCVSGGGCDITLYGVLCKGEGRPPSAVGG